MTTIEQLLGDLLLRHNCVIVPSFGGFVAKQVSARVDFKSGKMYPPSKSLLFNKQLINNDGLLINAYSVANDVSFDQASEAVDSKVREWHMGLKTGERVEIDRIGYLFYDAEKNLCFEQDRFANLLLESFGLGQVHFLTEEDVQIAEREVIRLEVEETLQEESIATPTIIVDLPQKTAEQAAEVEPSEQEVANEQPKRRKVWRYVAAACILPIAFYSVWIPMKTDVLESGVLSISDFNPFHVKTEGVYQQQELPEEVKTTEGTTLEQQVKELEAGVHTYTYAYDDDTNIAVVLESGDTERVIEESSPAPDPTFEAATMHYIVGCFGDKTNATNLVAKLKEAGLEGSIVDFHNGLHRVSAGGAISLEGLAGVKEAASQLGLSGWTLK